MAKKSNTVRVMATRNLDLMNMGVPTEIDRDEQVEKYLQSGDLIEVDEAGQPKAGANTGQADAGQAEADGGRRAGR